jgi:hypothetical protein
MRILLLDVHLRYMNPTPHLIPRIVAQAGETMLFGPGYVSSETLARGVEAFADRHGPFDVVIATEHVVFAGIMERPEADRAYQREYVRRVSIDAIRRRQDMLTGLRSIGGIKVASLLESDYYTFSAEYIERLRDEFPLLIGWNHQFFAPVADLGDVRREAFAARATDTWLNFTAANAHRIIPFAHFVSDAEFDYGALEHRPAEWSIPGVPYDKRRRARVALSQNGARISRRRPLLAPILARLGLRPFSRPWFLAHYQETFREEIRRARYAFTCGSALGYPVRKFFEIPALGAVLACAPCHGFEALGFRHGENAFACEPDDLPALSRALNADLAAAQSVADAGRRLVAERHTLTVRGAQLKSALTRALAGQWNGASWQRGELVPVPAPLYQASR